MLHTKKSARPVPGGGGIAIVIEERDPSGNKLCASWQVGTFEFTAAARILPLVRSRLASAFAPESDVALTDQDVDAIRSEVANATVR